MTILPWGITYRPARRAANTAVSVNGRTAPDRRPVNAIPDSRTELTAYSSDIQNSFNGRSFLYADYNRVNTHKICGGKTPAETRESLRMGLFTGVPQ